MNKRGIYKVRSALLSGAHFFDCSILVMLKNFDSSNSGDKGNNCSMGRTELYNNLCHFVQEVSSFALTKSQMKACWCFP